MIKVIKLAAAAGAACFMASNAMAIGNGLMLCSDKTVTAPIQVACGPEGGPYVNTGKPVPAGGGCVLGPVALPWSAIQNFLKGAHGECQFTGSKGSGSALVNIKNVSGVLNGALYGVSISGYTVSYPGGYAPSASNFAPVVAVTVSQNS